MDERVYCMLTLYVKSIANLELQGYAISMHPTYAHAPNECTRRTKQSLYATNAQPAFPLA
jgi:hypothetical protein